MKSRLVAKAIITVARIACNLSSAALGFPRGTAEQRVACMGDAFRFCARFIPNALAIEGCLE
jgi:hypothetical protein